MAHFWSLSNEHQWHLRAITFSWYDKNMWLHKVKQKHSLENTDNEEKYSLLKTDFPLQRMLFIHPKALEPWIFMEMSWANAYLPLEYPMACYHWTRLQDESPSNLSVIYFRWICAFWLNMRIHRLSECPSKLRQSCFHERDFAGFWTKSNKLNPIL